MTYRVPKKRRDQLAKMREAKAIKRETGIESVRPLELPLLRRRIVITNYDHGEVTHTLDLYRSDRVDCCIYWRINL